MDNQAIASELLKVAESLTATNVADVADEEGLYHKFTGTIDFEGSKGDVWDATFELTSRGLIEWENGVWKDGHWKGGTWNDGVWKGGTWKDGTWKDGTWLDGDWWGGEWKRGTWKGGDWEGGDWKSIKPHPIMLDRVWVSTER